jgi:PleD family two-component response regulator
VNKNRNFAMSIEMVRLSHERVLLIGDEDRSIQATVASALPAAHIKSVGNLFDAIAELTMDQFTTVLAPAEPMERRPEAAIRVLRQLSGDGRLLLFGHPTLEPLSRKMMEFGCDDYLVTPVTAGELLDALRNPEASDEHQSPVAIPPYSPERIGLTDIVLESLLNQPHDGPAAVIQRINSVLPPPYRLISGDAATQAASDAIIISHSSGLRLQIPSDAGSQGATDFLSRLAGQLSQIQAITERHVGLQKLAITDELTNVFNGRYFRHFLGKIIDKARSMRFPVTLFLFDIDDFKNYNDKFGHAVGDKILKQTAGLMRRCVRDHDLVARIGGDEFAVVFWEKEGPRQPREPNPAAANRTPQEPREILDRFRKSLASQEFPELGHAGKGTLAISGGLAVFPWNAHDATGLIEAADKQLMFGAKRAGKNRIHLIGAEDTSQL